MPTRPFRTPPASRGALSVCLAGIIWGTAPIAFDLIHARTALSAVAISALRIGLAALVLVVAAAIAGQLHAVSTAIRTHPARIGLIGAGVAAYQSLWFAAIPYVGASVATVLSLGLAPVIVTGWESWTSRRLPRGLRLGAVSIAVAGLLLVTLPTPTSTPTTNAVGIGVLLALASGVLYAVTTITARTAATTIAALPLSTATTAIGALCLLPIAVITGPITTTDLPSLAAIGYLGIITMAAASLLLFTGLRTAPASTATVATLLEPATATVLAVLLLGETLTLPTATGIVLILSAVIGLSTQANEPGHAAQRSVGEAD